MIVVAISIQLFVRDIITTSSKRVFMSVFLLSVYLHTDECNRLQFSTTQKFVIHVERINIEK